MGLLLRHYFAVAIQLLTFSVVLDVGVVAAFSSGAPASGSSSPRPSTPTSSTSTRNKLCRRGQRGPPLLSRRTASSLFLAALLPTVSKRSPLVGVSADFVEEKIAEKRLKCDPSYATSLSIPNCIPYECSVKVYESAKFMSY